MRHRLSMTHTLTQAGSNAIVGYYTLAAASIPFERVPEALRERARMSRYPALSATLIAPLARHEVWRGSGIGELLLVDALRRAWDQTASVGAAFVIVDAINEAAADFYRRYSFIPFEDDDRTLFLPMIEVARLFAR